MGTKEKRIAKIEIPSLDQLPDYIRPIVKETEEVRHTAYLFRRRARTVMQALHDVLYDSLEHIALYDKIKSLAARLYLDEENHDRVELQQLDRSLRLGVIDAIRKGSKK